MIEELLGVDPWLLSVGLLVTYLAATVHATIGFGFSMICVPVLSLVHESLTPVPQLFALLPLTVGMAVRERKDIDYRGIGWVVLGRLIGALIGVGCLMVVSEITLKAVIGSIVLCAVILVWQQPSIGRTRLTEIIGGTASGFGALVSSIGGPMLALLYRNEKGSTLRASMAAIFVIGLCFSFGFRILSGFIAWRDVTIGGCFMIPTLIGLKTSNSFIVKIEGSKLKGLILMVAGSSSIALIAQGFSWF